MTEDVDEARKNCKCIDGILSCFYKCKDCGSKYVDDRRTVNVDKY